MQSDRLTAGVRKDGQRNAPRFRRNVRPVGSRRRDAIDAYRNNVTETNAARRFKMHLEVAVGSAVMELVPPLRVVVNACRALNENALDGPDRTLSKGQGTFPFDLCEPTHPLANDARLHELPSPTARRGALSGAEGKRV